MLEGVRSIASRDVRGEAHSGNELGLHSRCVACLPGPNLKLVRMTDRRVNRLVICSSMFKSACDAKDDP